MIEYIVNKDKRTVVAMIKLVDKDGDSILTFKDSDNIFDNLWDTLMRLKHNKDIFNKDYFSKANKMYFPNHMTAKAKCSPEDEWDEDYGKLLARERLVEKIHNYRSDSYIIIYNLVKEIECNL